VKISISATNPCHLYPLALELAKRASLGCYYSGYPAWKLAPPDGLPVRTNSLRTNIVYGLLKFFPESLRPNSRDLFLWQDHGFDAWAGRSLDACDFIHAMPGQCLRTFEKAKSLGIRTVLNHATGPVREWVRIMEPEYRRAGLRLADVCPYDAEYFRREEREYALADFHCAASTVVREQLEKNGVPREKIMLIPYGADRSVFFPAPAPAANKTFRIVFAGQVGLRKGLKTFLDALESAKRSDWRADFYGAVLGEAKPDLAAYRGETPLEFHGAVPQPALAEAFRRASVLVLPSLEEGFGLVVPQALNTGLPCIVSDRVGAKDLIRHRENGSVFQVKNSAALLDELFFWESRRVRVEEKIPWSEPAETLISLSEQLLLKP
jgi:glycosyltransferase involved in cell wall biosynthesis